MKKLVKKFKKLWYNILFFLFIGRWDKIHKTLHIDITSKCNLRCPGCFHFGRKVPEDRSDEETIAFLKAKHQAGCRKIWVYGGEPTLRSNLFDLIDKLFYDIHVITNGQIKIDPKYNFRIWVSLDGPKAVNDVLRGPGSFDKVVNNYRGDQRVGLVMTVKKSNYKYIPYMVSLVKELGVKTITYTFYSQGSNFDQRDPEVLEPEDLKNIENLITKELKTNGQYILNDHATLKSMLYEKISSPKWDNKCYLSYALLESYSSDLKPQKCCNSAIDCEHCRILPPHQFHCLLTTKKAPLMKYAFGLGKGDQTNV